MRYVRTRSTGRRRIWRPGGTLRISLKKPGQISKIFSFKIQRGKLAALSNLCQTPGSKKLRKTCPTFT